MSTPVRDRIYGFVRDFTSENGYSPSIREIGAGVGISSPSAVYRHMGLLAAEGRIRWVPGVARSVRAIEQEVMDL